MDAICLPSIILVFFYYFLFITTRQPVFHTFSSCFSHGIISVHLLGRLYMLFIMRAQFARKSLYLGLE